MLALWSNSPEPHMHFGPIGPLIMIQRRLVSSTTSTQKQSWQTEPFLIVINNNDSLTMLVVTLQIFHFEEIGNRINIQHWINVSLTKMSVIHGVEYINSSEAPDCFVFLCLRVLRVWHLLFHFDRLFSWCNMYINLRKNRRAIYNRQSRDWQHWAHKTHDKDKQSNKVEN